MIMETVSFLVLLMVAISHVVFIRPVTGYVCHGYCFFYKPHSAEVEKACEPFSVLPISTYQREATVHTEKADRKLVWYCRNFLAKLPQLNGRKIKLHTITNQRCGVYAETCLPIHSMLICRTMLGNYC